VKDSRPTEDGAAIRRRRLCPQCGGRFTTFERVQLRELTILKRSGRRAPFDREKLVRSITLATRKRPVDPERIERMVSGIVRRLESLGETELASHVVGEMVMKALKALDEVAYVRYASVYRDFRQTEDFARFLSDEGLADEPSVEEAPAGPPPGEAAGRSA
jgi:transcriptional repressor NrdR